MDFKAFAKDNWPLLVGGGVGIFLIMRMRGGGQTASAAPVIMNTAPSEAAIMASAQADAVRQQSALATRQMEMSYNLETAKIAASTAATNSTIGLQRDQLSAMVSANNSANQLDHDKALMTFQLGQGALEVQNAQNIQAARTANITAAGGFLQAQGNAAGSAGTAVAQMIGQLNQPAMIAIQNAAIENSAALNAAAVTAVGGYQAQQGTFSGITDVLKEFVKMPAATMAGMPNMLGAASGVIGNLGGSRGFV